MLRLLALAAHFSPLNPGPYDPAVVDLLNAYFEPKPVNHPDREAVTTCHTPVEEAALEAA